MSNATEHQPFRSEFLEIRGIRYHLRHWGQEGAPKLFMMHGWMDVSASFQFVVDHLQHDWHVIAADWRGFGLTKAPATDCYWFPDYLADLDAILQHYSPDEPVNLLGHSMGANVVTMYAGSRPERVRKLIDLEGFGLPSTTPEQAPKRYRRWMDEIRTPMGMKTYATLQEVAQRLQKTNPRLSDDKAAFLAQHWAEQGADGQWAILGDPAHKRVSPILFHTDEMLACWQAVTAPVMWAEAEDTNVWEWMGAKEQARPEIERRLSAFKDLEKHFLTDAGHMLHHDQPALLASLIEAFLLR